MWCQEEASQEQQVGQEVDLLRFVLALLAESEDGKVAVSEAAKKVGAMWKALIFLNIKKFFINILLALRICDSIQGVREGNDFRATTRPCTFDMRTVRSA